MKTIITTTVLALFFFVSYSQQYTFKADLLTARNTPSCAVVNDTIYVMGGSNSNGMVCSMEAYNSVANTWSLKTPPPQCNLEAFACTINGLVYLVGGYEPNAPDLNNVQVYDPATDSWTQKAPMPTSRSLISGAVINGKIYITGGWFGAYTATEVYDPVLNSWSTVANAPLGMLQNNSGANLHGDFYFIGGRDYDYMQPTIYDDVFRYNVGNNLWSSVAALPTPLFSGSAATLDGKIYYFGGGAGIFTPNYNSLYIYNDTTNTWTSGLSMPVRRSGHTAAVLNGKVYLIGGADSVGNTVPTVIEYSNTSSPLSIKLIKLSAVNTGNVNKVDWSTEAEHPGDRFELERSADGLNFNKIYDKNAHGERSNYAYIDKTPSKGWNYYRLRMIEPNGTIAYSNVVRAFMETDGVVLEAYPNPGSDNLTISIAGTQGSNASIQLIDLTGKIIETIMANDKTISLAMKHLAKGTYLIKYVDANTSKIIKVSKH